MTRFVAQILCVFGALMPLLSRGQDTFTVTFDGPPNQPPGSIFSVQYYWEQMMLFDGGLGRAWTNLPPGWPSDGTPYIDGPNRLRISQKYSEPFGLVSVDLAGYSSVVPDLDATFIGYRPDGSTITTNFSGRGTNFETYFFAPEWSCSLSQVIVSTTSWAMDNLVVQTNTPGDFEYTVGSNSVALLQYKGHAGSVAVPATFLGHSITGIIWRGFSYSAVTNVTLPDTVTEIGAYAFNNCTNLASLGPTSNLTDIGANAFAGCASLTNFFVPETVTNIGSDAFAGCSSLQSLRVPDAVKSISFGLVSDCQSLTNLTFGPGITNIGDYAFGNCARLQSMVVPSGITSIGNGVFTGCAAITNITLPPGITNIGYQAFSGCTKLSGLAIPDHVISIGDSAFASCGSLSNITVPDGVTSIRASTFYYCTFLSGINISTNINSIGESAFEGCANLPSIVIPAGVTNLGKRALTDCASLSVISVDALNPNYCSVGGVLFSKDQTTLLQCPGAIAGAFTIPATVASVSEAAFYGCGNLSYVIIPNSVTNLGAWAFDSCANLTNIAIPGSVASIGDGAFRDCINLTAILVDDSNPAFSSVDGVLFDKTKTNLIQYPAGKTGNYVVPDSVQSIVDWAFADSFGLEKVIIGRQVTAIGEYAFSGCLNLRTVFFTGNSPAFAGLGLFLGDAQPFVYRLPGKAGWSLFFEGLPTVLWNPKIQLGNPSPESKTNGFAFGLTGSSNLVLVVEACTNLAVPVWVSIATNTLVGGSSEFSDVEWTNYPSRFYRLSLP